MSGLPSFLPTSYIASVLCTCISMYKYILAFVLSRDTQKSVSC